MSFDSGLVKSRAAPHYITPSPPTTSLAPNRHQLAVHGSDASKLFSTSLPKIAEARPSSTGQAATHPETIAYPVYCCCRDCIANELLEAGGSA